MPNSESESKSNIESKRIIEQFRSLMQVAATAQKTVMIINGGAVIALLTFLGNAQFAGSERIAESLYWFVFGVACAGITTFLSYFAQLYFLESLKTNDYAYLSAGKFFRFFAILLVAFSYVGFIGGSVIATQGFNDRVSLSSNSPSKTP
ncbi:MAG: hypothetical protein OEZ68_11965 [Gammaproteobacteria bacterium]|nr:hypothetical protein [Gammaproteobacteria bacterium]MDH5801510.1 hypothetical protein [Gammaproteobacteria bacterium]